MDQSKVKFILFSLFMSGKGYWCKKKNWFGFFFQMIDIVFVVNFMLKFVRNNDF